MKLFAFLCCVGLAHSALVRRDADAKAEAGGYGAVVGGAPVCKSVPVKTCVPRKIQTPRKVCRQESDEIVDITITEHCEEVITTTCQQTSRSSAVLALESKIVATGVDATPDVTVTHGNSAHHGAAVIAPIVHGAVGHSGYRKREADADADASYGLGYAAAPPVEVSPSVCNSVPVKQCNNETVSVPRKVAKTVCAVHVDVTTVQDCKEVITTHCSESTQQVAHTSNVLGQETKVGPETVVATHGNAAIAVAAPIVPLYGHAVVGHALVGNTVAGHAVAGHANAGYNGV